MILPFSLLSGWCVRSLLLCACWQCAVRTGRRELSSHPNGRQFAFNPAPTTQNQPHPPISLSHYTQHTHTPHSDSTHRPNPPLTLTGRHIPFSPCLHLSVSIFGLLSLSLSLSLCGCLIFHDGQLRCIPLGGTRRKQTTDLPSPAFTYEPCPARISKTNGYSTSGGIIKPPLNSFPAPFVQSGRSSPRRRSSSSMPEVRTQTTCPRQAESSSGGARTRGQWQLPLLSQAILAALTCPA